MEHELALEDGPAAIPAGTGVLLLHPSIGETDRIDTDFLADADRFLVVSTRTTAREVEQKLDHYELDADRAEILDTISVDRGYSRRKTENVRYVSSPDDLDGIVAVVEEFLASNDGELRVSVDSLTEMAYYADVDRVLVAAEQLLALLEEYGAVGLFHLSKEVHDAATRERFRDLFDGVVDLDDGGNVTVEMN